MIKMITRTMRTLVVEVEYVDMLNKTVEYYTTEIPYCKMKDVKKVIEKTAERTVKILDAKVIEEKETVYGMPEADFLRLAKPVIRGNNGTAKPLEDCNPNDNENGGDSNAGTNAQDNAENSEGTQVPNETVDDTADRIAAKKARKLNK